MPQSKTAAGPGLNGAFFPLKGIRNNLRLGQNLVLKIDWPGVYFGLGQILEQNNPKLGQN